MSITLRCFLRLRSCSYRLNHLSHCGSLHSYNESKYVFERVKTSQKLFSKSLGTVSSNHGHIQSCIQTKLLAQLKSTSFAPQEASINKLLNLTNVRRNHQKIITSRRKVCILGGGSWGTAVADLVSYNVIKYPEFFDPEVILYLRDSNLCQVIETKRENTKYLPNIRLHPNLKPVSFLDEALSFADIIIFAIPHEFISDVCYNINDFVFPRNPIGISLIKGLYFDNKGNLERISQLIERMLGIKVGILSGANVASEVAKRQYCEATLCPPVTGTNIDKNLVEILKVLFSTDYFKVNISQDQATVEICGALKNIIACGAGLVDGLGFGINTKSAAIACGFRELVSFIELVNSKYDMKTLFQTCGIGDVIASSFGGRNRKMGEAFIKYRNVTNLNEIEQQVLKGQKLQGASTAKSVYQLLSKHDLTEKFPFFSAIHLVFNENHDPIEILNAIRIN